MPEVWGRVEATQKVSGEDERNNGSKKMDGKGQERQYQQTKLGTHKIHVLITLDLSVVKDVAMETCTIRQSSI